MNDQKWVTIRIDKETLDAIKAEAAKQSRSVSKQILFAIKKFLAEKV